MYSFIEHPLIKLKTAEARTYQQVLAANVLRNGNTMIVAPTAFGKTLVGVLVAAERLKKVQGSKALILAPSKPLTIQHEENFRYFLNVKCTSITGAIKPHEREKRWNESQIICATPQTVESDLLNNRYDFSDVSFAVFDECHHAVGSYAYVYLGQRYLKTAKNYLILGLTASPGSDQGKIKEICENLFIKDVVVKTEEDPDVKPYFNPIEVDWVKVKMNKELEKIKDHINKALQHRLKLLKNLNVIPTISVNKTDILKARTTVQNQIARAIKPPKKSYQAISILSIVINLHHSLELFETQGVNTFNKYISRLKKKNTKASKSLFRDADFSQAITLSEQAEKNGWEHPKLKKLVDILKNELNLVSSKITINTDNNKKKRKIIVFTQFRDTLEMIYQKLQTEGINSVKFFGQGSRDGEKGLTQNEQKRIIKSFKIGVYDVLLSTSVAEEGIDIPAVDLVILYEPVPSEVRMIQRRGRTGRKSAGKMKILITKGTRDEGYYWVSLNKEKKMKKQLMDKKLWENLNKESLDKIKDDRHKDKNDDNKKVLVYADSREGNSKVLRALYTINVDVRIKSMAAGDYQISDEVAIERKTAKDFINSIVDKRLYKQARIMQEEFKKPLMILEGDDFYSGFLSPEVIRGSLAAIAIDFGISIIPTRNPEDSAAMIKRISIREQNGKTTPIQIRTERKPVNIWEQQLFIIESLPKIGPVTAKKLLEKFATVQAVIEASTSELQEIDGIGKKTAENIRKVLNTRYLHFKKDDNDKKLI